MDHSGNYAQIIETRYGAREARIKVYVYDEVGRFVTLGRLELSQDHIERMLGGINMRAQDEAGQQDVMLPPWQ